MLDGLELDELEEVTLGGLLVIEDDELDDESEDEIYEQVATDYEDDEVIHDEDNESKPQE